MTAILRGLTIAALVLLAPLSVNAQTTRTHTVKQILLDGQDVASASAMVTLRAGTVEKTIQRGERIDDGTRVDIPAHVGVVIVSTGGASTVRLEPGASVTFCCAAMAGRRSSRSFERRSTFLEFNTAIKLPRA